MTMTFRLLRPKVSSVYNSYWKFAAERQAIFFKRFNGEPGPWTADPVLLRHKFTNAYRASDRVSQYLINHVIYQNGHTTNFDDPDDTFFRILLFKVFNRISTWQHLEQAVGKVTFAEYNFESYDAILSKLKDHGEPGVNPRNETSS